MSHPLKHAIDVDALEKLLGFVNFSRELIRAQSLQVAEEPDAMPRRKEIYLSMLNDFENEANAWSKYLYKVVHGKEE